jgi:TP901 family phage tail tape measure protein
VPIRTAVNFENAMLGVAKQIDGARDAAGNLTPVYYSMAKQIQGLGREIPLATNELAEMVAAGARMGVAKDQLIEFTRTGAMMADAFGLPAGQLADDMGKIAGLFKIPIPRIGELADAINYLDDNSQATGADIIDVMRRVGGMAQTLRMPAKEAAALGSTFLHLGSSAEVAGTASNAVLRILGAASVQSRRVRKGMEGLGFNADALQVSMSKDATGTILTVLDALNKLPDEKRMAAATQLFGAEYGDDVAKLSSGVAEYRRQLQLVNSEQQKGSMSREFAARLKTTGAQWQITKNRMAEVGVAIGGVLLPAINGLMKSAAPLIEGFAEWSRANPGVIKGVVGSAIALSGLRVVAIGANLAWTSLKGPVLSVMGFIARFRATGAIAAMGRFGPMAMRVATALRTVGAAVAAIGGGPITVAVAALTLGALVVRKYWQPIAAWITGYFQGVRAAISPAMAEMGKALAPLKPAWDAVVGAVSKAFNWFMKLIEPVNMTSEQLKAASESGRTFGSVVGAVMSFVIGRVTAVIKAISWVITNIGKVADAASMIPGIGFVGQGVKAAGNWMFGDDTPKAPTTAARVPVPTRGRRAVVPAVAAGGRSAAAPGTQTHTYNITQQPGESGEALAKRIEAERRRNAAVASRGSLVDAA